MNEGPGELCLLIFSSERTISTGIISPGQRANDVIYLCDTKNQRYIRYTKKGLPYGSSNTKTMGTKARQEEPMTSATWLLLAHTRVCSRVTIAGMVPSFERFACSVIPAAPETDVGRLLDQGQLSSTTKPCYSLPTSGSLVFGRVPTTLTEKNDSLCLSHSGKLYSLCPAPASPLGAWNFSLCS